MSKEDGGPAFPVQPFNAGARYWADGAEGMTLRDYFAANCDQPGQAEIVSAAGLVFKNGRVWVDSDVSIGTFDQWYSDLPIDRRFSLYATVRYQMADAMLKARAK